MFKERQKIPEEHSNQLVKNKRSAQKYNRKRKLKNINTQNTTPTEQPQPHKITTVQFSSNLSMISLLDNIVGQVLGRKCLSYIINS